VFRHSQMIQIRGSWPKAACAIDRDLGESFVLDLSTSTTGCCLTSPAVILDSERAQRSGLSGRAASRRFRTFAGRRSFGSSRPKTAARCRRPGRSCPSTYLASATEQSILEISVWPQFRILLQDAADELVHTRLNDRGWRISRVIDRCRAVGMKRLHNFWDYPVTLHILLD